MYLLPKFLSKIIKHEGFVLTREKDSRKFLIGNPSKAKPLEVKLSEKASELKLLVHPEKWFPEYIISEDKFNKILLDLEILGLITVSWITKDERRIETVVIEKVVDKIEEQNKEAIEKDYEASFPGFEK